MNQKFYKLNDEASPVGRGELNSILIVIMGQISDVICSNFIKWVSDNGTYGGEDTTALQIRGEKRAKIIS